MFGRGEPVDLQVRRLEADIVRVRFDQVANRLAWEDAIAVEGRALDMARGARAVQARCERLEDEFVEAISSLQDEIAELVPKPRTGD